MKKVTRPWGWYITLLESPLEWWVKFLNVEGRTSLQVHRHRAEIHISKNGVKHVKRNEEHRLEKGRYIEIAYGFPYERDIVRLEDDYGRV